jgi:hypothetical protein
MARMRIGDMLIRAGLIDEMQLSAGLAHQKQWGGRLGDALIDKGFVDEIMLYRGLAHQTGVPLVSLTSLDVTRAALAAVPREICERHELIPVALVDRLLTVASADPSNVSGIDEVRFATGLNVKMVLAPAREIEWSHRRFFLRMNETCPPARTRQARVTTNQMQIIQMGHSQSPPAPVTMEGDALPPDPTLHMGDPVRSLEDRVRDREESLRQSTALLRLLVESCVSRGIFTREEYLERMRKNA